jgi:hypothetical protein
MTPCIAGGNDHLRALRFQALSQMISVVCLVGQQAAGWCDIL